MNDDITTWKQLYHKQEVSMTTLTLELVRLRGRDRRRYVAEGLATLLVLGAGIYYLTLGTVPAVFAGIGLLLFVATFCINSLAEVVRQRLRDKYNRL